MNDEERAFVREMVRDVVRAEVQDIPHKCLIEANVPVEVHRDHHRAIIKLTEDMTNIRKAFLAGVVTALTGGLVWFVGFGWVWLKGKMGGW